MKFKAIRRVPDGCLLGEASDPAGSERELCARYATVASRLLEPGSARLHPVVLDPWPFGDEGAPLRRVYDADEDGEPELHRKVCALYGRRRPLDEDLVVAIPPDVLDAAPSDAELAMIVVMDAASWEADNSAVSGNLGWA